MLAVASRRAADNSQMWSGGGSLPPSRHERQISTPPSRVPAKANLTNTMKRRYAPVFPLYTLAASWRIRHLQRSYSALCTSSLSTESKTRSALADRVPLKE